MPLPARPAKVPDEVAADILRRHVRQESDSHIARQLSVNRGTVTRVRKRVLAAAAVLQPLEEERVKAVSVYREIQRVAWQNAVEAAELGTFSPAPFLSEVRQCQARIDSVLGLDAVKPEVIEVHQFQHIVASLIREEAPELADRLAGKLLELRNGDES